MIVTFICEIVLWLCDILKRILMSKIHTELFKGKMYIWDLLQNNMGGRKISGDGDETFWPQFNNCED